MIFTTYWFIAFILIFYPVFWTLRNPKHCLYFLILACIVFHGRFAGSAGVLPIVVLGVLVYFAGISGKKWAHIVGMAACVFALLFYKYSLFFFNSGIGAISPELGKMGAEWASKVLPTVPPLAISFFTFEFVHYLYDVKKGQKPMNNVTDFVAFTLFFPSLVAGPIKRYESFLPSLQKGLSKVTLEDVKIGILRIAVGYFKKVVIADNLSGAIHYYENSFSSFGFYERWLFVIAISLRIVFDFSGYSDMAIGFARLAGINIPENFNWPYLASSIKSFWQRWHISLSSWIRDYVYVPMGGNRHGAVRTVVHGLLAFGLCGLWHGAASNFVFWGVYHGAGLAVNNSYRNVPYVGPKLSDFFNRFKVVSWAITMIFVGVGWVYFFYEMKQANQMVGLLFSK
jgi:alginate O-acetyltransferase complex protein AlgI